jgi:NADP-dependent 3-hydroxy acid dehydrogenase YdfG
MKKTVLITGTSSGFGKACAKVLVKNGWNVVASMRRPYREEELTKLRDVLVTRLDVEDSKTN